MKLLLPIISFFLSSSMPVYSFQFFPSRSTVNAPVFSRTGKDVMSDVDIMCLENAADLCSLYEECDIEEREALLNRFTDETEIMAERIATITALVKHLKIGDHEILEDEEVATFREKILKLVNAEIYGSEGLSP